MASASEDDLMDTAADLEDDLFGDDDDNVSEKNRELSDRELDSGDDEGRNDRAHNRGDEDENNATTGREARILDSTLWRQPWPKPFDGEFDELRLPKFLGIEPTPYNPETFELPTTDHHSDTKSANFSANAVATSKMRYKKDPGTGKLQSNTVVYRWSDGSTTIAVGEQHYELQTKPLVPPKENRTYKEVLDSHSYLASPSITSQLLVMIGHMTNQHTVRPNKEIEDDALEKLQRSLAAAARGGHRGDDKNGPEMITNTQDPELQKKRAEMAEKERMKLQRRRETAAAKADDRRGGRGLGGGLNVDDLEGRNGRRAPGAGRKPPGAKRPRRRPEYDSDDDMPRGRNREDEYDKNDDFLASSDEEGEDGPELDDEEEEELEEESEQEAPRRKKQKKSSKPEELSDADADADADLDDDDVAGGAAEAPAGRGRKRNIIEDDEDDE
ncbi:hypothetical protein BP6252_06193 [Coleophoma cylindrospora]|uniref:RNA polymerase-associated protein LEO1 n=1 Tax=Coleophoma cylindrospora TaxID=1849047 RepID=A0A3D8RMM7_9HELO|nr:hypothetical protein BP6252_06193 [Coleophoma cylindrospora]